MLGEFLASSLDLPADSCHKALSKMKQRFRTNCSYVLRIRQQAIRVYIMRKK